MENANEEYFDKGSSWYCHSVWDCRGFTGSVLGGSNGNNVNNVGNDMKQQKDMKDKAKSIEVAYFWDKKDRSKISMVMTKTQVLYPKEEYIKAIKRIMRKVKKLEQVELVEGEAGDIQRNFLVKTDEVIKIIGGEQYVTRISGDRRTDLGRGEKKSRGSKVQDKG
jgi:hypothetical protein